MKFETRFIHTTDDLLVDRFLETPRQRAQRIMAKRVDPAMARAIRRLLKSWGINPRKARITQKGGR